MANAVNTLTESMKIAFDMDKVNKQTPVLLDFIKLFFPDVFRTDQEVIPLDQIVDKKTLAGYRSKNGSSNVMKYNPGMGTVYNPIPIALKTPVSEDLAGSVTAGMSVNAPVSEQLNLKYQRIQGQQVDKIYRTMVKQAMDIFTTGGFTPVDGSGNAVSEAISFGRDGSLTISAAYAADPIKQLTDAYDALKVKGCPLNGLYALVGDTFMARLEANTDFQNNLKIQGLDAGRVYVSSDERSVAVLCKIKLPKRNVMITLLGFNEYYENSSGTMVPFMPEKGIIMSSFNTPRTQAYAGISIADTDSQTMVRYDGEIISDRFVEKDPDQAVLRTQSRPLLIPGFIDHTVYAVSSD